MKRLVCLICVFCVLLKSFSQEPLYITNDKTSSLVFLYPVIHIDRGSKDILVQAIPESQSIILVKAACSNFHPTSLTVLTSDGSIYSFIVSYDSMPPTLINRIKASLSTGIEQYANAILDNPPLFARIKDESWEVSGRLDGIYIKENTIFCQLGFTNNSSIDYDFEFIRIYLRDKRKTNRTATQEVELKPLYTAGNDKMVKAFSSTTIVIALEKFTIPDAKSLVIEAHEKNGGRNLLLKISNRELVKASVLPNLK